MTSDWVDQLAARGVGNFPGFTLSRLCFFCGHDASGSRTDALHAYVAAGSYESSDDTFVVATDAWICHEDCIRSANPQFDRAALVPPTSGSRTRRASTCFFCGTAADDPLDDTWAIFSISDGAGAHAWLSHPRCLHSAHHPDAPMWRVWDEEPRAG